jgi:hypothetical protein
MACSDLSVQDEGAVYRLGKGADLSMINRAKYETECGSELARESGVSDNTDVD